MSRDKMRCPRCKGNGTIYRTDGRPMLCPTCGGAGEVDAATGLVTKISQKEEEDE